MFKQKPHLCTTSLYFFFCKSNRSRVTILGVTLLLPVHFLNQAGDNVGLPARTPSRGSLSVCRTFGLTSLPPLAGPCLMRDPGKEG